MIEELLYLYLYISDILRIDHRIAIVKFLFENHCSEDNIHKIVVFYSEFLINYSNKKIEEN